MPNSGFYFARAKLYQERKEHTYYPREIYDNFCFFNSSDIIGACNIIFKFCYNALQFMVFDFFQGYCPSFFKF